MFESGASKGSDSGGCDDTDEGPADVSYSVCMVAGRLLFGPSPELSVC